MPGKRSPEHNNHGKPLRIRAVVSLKRQKELEHLVRGNQVLWTGEKTSSLPFSYQRKAERQGHVSSQSPPEAAHVH